MCTLLCNIVSVYCGLQALVYAQPHRGVKVHCNTLIPLFFRQSIVDLLVCFSPLSFYMSYSQVLDVRKWPQI